MSIDTTTHNDIGDITVTRLVRERSHAGPVVVRYAGPIVDIITGPTDNPWSVNEMVMSDWYDVDRIDGNGHDAVDVDTDIRPVEIKGTSPRLTDDSKHHNGTFILRKSQHQLLIDVPVARRTESGFSSTGDYLVCAYDRIGDHVIILSDTRISARDLDRHTVPHFYKRIENDSEAAVEWTDVPGIQPGEMLDRIAAADIYLRALGYDPDEYCDDITRVRDTVEAFL